MYSELIKRIKSHDHPSTKSRKIAIFINDKLREKEITVYEGYLLNQECLRFLEKALFEAAWNEEPSVYDIIHFLNQKLLSHVLKEKTDGLEAVLNKLSKRVERKSHYIVGLYPQLICNPPTKEALEELDIIRKDKNIPDYCYPHHASSFPGEDFNTEKALLECTSLDKNVKPEIIDLIVELSLIE